MSRAREAQVLKCSHGSFSKDRPRYLDEELEDEPTSIATKAPSIEPGIMLEPTPIEPITTSKLALANLTVKPEASPAEGTTFPSTAINPSDEVGN